jgi:RNA polymerase sigma-70 factor, ECF subfamily
MRQSAAEDRERFSGLFEENYSQVQAFAVRRVGSDLADEVTAETFLVAWQRLDVVPAKRAKARELITRERLGPVLEDDFEHEALWRAWEQLADTDREVLSLIVWEELPVRDAARVLGVPASVFSVRLHRARRRLERHLLHTTVPAITAIKEAT